MPLAADFDFERELRTSRVDGDVTPVLLADVIRQAVRTALDACQGNKSEAARRLGISRPRLLRILEGADDQAEDRGDASETTDRDRRPRR